MQLPPVLAELFRRVSTRQDAQSAAVLAEIGEVKTSLSNLATLVGAIMSGQQDLTTALGTLHTFLTGLPAAIQAMQAAHDSDDDTAFENAANQITTDLAQAQSAMSTAKSSTGAAGSGSGTDTSGQGATGQGAGATGQGTDTSGQGATGAAAGATGQGAGATGQGAGATGTGQQGS